MFYASVYPVKSVGDRSDDDQKELDYISKNLSPWRLGGKETEEEEKKPNNFRTFEAEKDSVLDFT